MRKVFTLSTCVLFVSLFPFLFSCQKEVKPLTIPTVDQVGAKAMPEEIAPLGKLPFEMPEPQRPVFPELTVSIADKGAVEGEAITTIVNQTIDEVSAQGGGMVIVPAGKWKSSRIELKSNVNLHIAEGAEIEFSEKVEDYLPAVFTRHEGIEVMSAGAFIYANEQENIAVTGKGTLWGPPMETSIRKLPNGPSVVEKDVDYNAPIEERVFDGMDGRYFYRPKSIAPIRCKNVLIEGITINRSLLWNIAPTYCENVIIRGVTVNSVEVPSGDGIDIESCKNVLVEYSTLNNGDDCFTLKSGRAEDGIRVNIPTENVVIRYSLAQNGHGGITCGSETAGNIKNVYVHDCVFDGTRAALRFKTRRNRGGGSEKIFFERLRMININDVFAWDLLGVPYYMGELAERTPARAIDKLTPTVRDIHAKDLIVESAKRFVKATCIPEIPLSGVLIENVDANCEKFITHMDDVDGFTVRNSTIRLQNDTMNVLDGRNIAFEQVNLLTPSGTVVVNVEGEKSTNITFENQGKKTAYQGTTPLTVMVQKEGVE